MNKIIKWLQLGFEIYNSNGLLVEDMKDVARYVDEDRLEDMFDDGYYFFNYKHKIKVSNIDTYNAYFERDERWFI